jgi:hypothetical protein
MNASCAVSLTRRAPGAARRLKKSACASARRDDVVPADGGAAHAGEKIAHAAVTTVPREPI